jgi:hypothetical protein
MTREELKDCLGEDLCPYCPWTNNEVIKPRIGGCEGNYCEEALDTYIDEGLVDDIITD